MTRNRSVASVITLMATLVIGPAACVAETSTAVATTTAVAEGADDGVAVAVVAPDGREVAVTAGLESAYVMRGSDGQAYMVVDLAAAAAPAQAVRPSMGVALVIDRSGSMAGEKIVNARSAAQSFIQSMADGDVVSLFQYDDTVEMIAPPTVIEPQSRAALTAAVSGITPRGSTNLHGGLVAGIHSLTSAQAERPVRRVILISDGLANVGPSTPMELGNEAAGAAARGISVTTIGVGLDYDETVMGSVAVRSGGRFYHLQEPAQLAAILQTELNSLSATVARGVLIELAPAPGVTILGASGADMTRDGGVVRLAVGDMIGEQARQIVIPVQVPTTGGAELPLAAVTLRYRAAASDDERTHEARVAYRLAGSAADVTRGVRPEYAVAVERYRTTTARREAAELVAEGEAERAATVLASRAAESRRRARSLGGRAGAAIDFDADEVEASVAPVRESTSAPAARSMQLRLTDDAYEAEGY